MNQLEKLTIISLDCSKDALRLMSAQGNCDPEQVVYNYFESCTELVGQLAEFDSIHIMYSQLPFPYLFLGQKKPDVQTDYMRVLSWSNIQKGVLGKKLFKSWFMDGDKVPEAFPSIIMSIKIATTQDAVTELMDQIIQSLDTLLLGDLGVMTIDNEKITLSGYDPVKEKFEGWVAGDASYSMVAERLQNDGATIIAALFKTDGTSTLEKIYGGLSKNTSQSEPIPDKAKRDIVETEQHSAADTFDNNEPWVEKVSNNTSSSIASKLGSWASKVFETPASSHSEATESWAIQENSDEQYKKFKEANAGSVLEDAIIGSYFGRALRLFTEHKPEAARTAPNGLSFHLITAKNVPSIRKWIVTDADRGLVKKFLLEKLSAEDTEKLCTEVWGII